jgi:hypothetical protein
MRATKPELSSLAGTMASTTFLVFPRTPLLLGAVLGGEPRYARFVPAPVPVPPAFTGLPDRDASFERITSLVDCPRCRWQSSGVSPAELSDDLRARASGPSEGRVAREHERRSVSRVGCVRLFSAPADVVPLLGAFQRTSDVTGATVDKRGAPANATDRSEFSIPTVPREGCRHPEERDAFHRRYVRVRLRRDRSLRPPASASRSRRPHFFPRLGRVLLSGFASVTVRSPACRDVFYFERRAPL